MIVKKINELNWDVFTLEKEFNCTKGIYLPTETVVDGDIPFITAKSGNNGLSRFIGNKTLFDRNCITIEKIKLSAYYQPATFYCSHDVSVISNDKINAQNAHFITAMIMRNGKKYSYGRQAQLNVVKREKTMLPVDENGDIDYQYMTDYVTVSRKTMYAKYRSFAEKRIAEIGEYIQLSPLTSLDWQPFYITSIFAKIERGKRLKKADQISGNVPYISSTALNNGVDGFIQASKGTRVFNDCISLANSGSVGSAFYEPFEFVASDHVTHLKTERFNKWIYLFLTVAIEKQKCNFNFNREINDSRVRQMKIMLPINSENHPDYEYMERYAKNMMLKKYKQYLAFLDAKEKAKI